MENNLMDGITILSKGAHTFGYGDVIGIIIASVLLGSLIGLLVGGIMSDELITGVLTGFVVTIIIFFMAFYSIDRENYVTYKVTIDDTVSFNEFTNEYKILDQDGLIYEIRLKDTEDK